MALIQETPSGRAAAARQRRLGRYLPRMRLRLQRAPRQTVLRRSKRQGSTAHRRQPRRLRAGGSGAQSEPPPPGGKLQAECRQVSGQPACAQAPARLANSARIAAPAGRGAACVPAPLAKRPFSALEGVGSQKRLRFLDRWRRPRPWRLDHSEIGAGCSAARRATGRFSAPGVGPAGVRSDLHVDLRGSCRASEKSGLRV